MGKQRKQWLTIFLGSKITADGDCSHEIKRCLLLGRKVMTNLDSILKSRDIILPIKVHLVKAMVFPVVMYGCESWTIKKAESRRIDAFELCKDIQSVHPQGDQSWRDWCWSWNSNTLATWCGELTHLKTLMLGKIESIRQKMRWLDGITDTVDMLFGWTLRVGDGQGGLACCGSWGHKESDTTERLNWTELNAQLNATVLKGQFSTKYLKTIIKGWILRLYYWKKGLEKGSVKFILKEKFQETVVMVREI